VCEHEVQDRSTQHNTWCVRNHSDRLEHHHQSSSWMHDVSTPPPRVWCEHMPSHRHTRASVVHVDKSQSAAVATPARPIPSGLRPTQTADGGHRSSTLLILECYSSPTSARCSHARGGGGAPAVASSFCSMLTRCSLNAFYTRGVVFTYSGTPYSGVSLHQRRTGMLQRAESDTSITGAACRARTRRTRQTCRWRHW
jgi:hypothetical protein